MLCFHRRKTVSQAARCEKRSAFGLRMIPNSVQGNLWWPASTASFANLLDKSEVPCRSVDSYATAIDDLF